MDTRPLGGDSRWFLWLGAADLAEGAIGALWKLAQGATRKGRLDRHVRNLEKAGLIECRTAGTLDERIVRVTEAGHRNLAGDCDPEALWARKWDGLWRTAMFDVPESRNALRVRLRRTLRQLRFGWLQNSVWLSPDRVSDLVLALEKERVSAECLLFLEGRPAGGEDDAELVRSAWDFERLGTMHRHYLRLLKTRPRGVKAAVSGEWIPWLQAEDRAWRKIVRWDPFLPAVLLPPGYAGRTAWAARNETLREGAQEVIAALSLA
jgi:phenylacetic acid degradation operon negative regulatory protein